MTARPWGTTGRVTLGPERHQGADISRRVEVDGRQVGTVYNPRAVEWTAFAAYGALALRKDAYREGLPDLDAAVRWVLRRADAEVWRQERGPVWRVKSDPAVRDRYRYRWRVYMPGGAEYTTSGATGTRDGWEWALREVAKELTWAAALGPTP